MIGQHICYIEFYPCTYQYFIFEYNLFFKGATSRKDEGGSVCYHDTFSLLSFYLISPLSLSLSSN